MFVHFTIFLIVHIIHKKNLKIYSIERNVLPIFMVFKHANENVFHGIGDLLICLCKGFRVGLE